MTLLTEKTTNQSAKPFVKWAGGKSQLLSDMQKRYPKELGISIKRYCEPFVGGGAVLFDILSKYEMDVVLINDINSELINTYYQIKNNLDYLVEQLTKIQDEYWSRSKEDRKKYYYNKRDLFNSLKSTHESSLFVLKASLFIFLNRTCFNGLYRVNKKGQFNVPIGSYKKPTICDFENLTIVSNILKYVDIRCGDYEECKDFITKKTLVYIDPPYRPISETASFTSYTEDAFNDTQQKRLGQFVDTINALGAKVLVSNSDPKNIDKEDDFFDTLYEAYDIKRISAKRMINCNGDSRGNISELLITNYECP